MGVCVRIFLLFRFIGFPCKEKPLNNILVCTGNQGNNVSRVLCHLTCVVTLEAPVSG